ncbi:MAG: 50S ribosomal protein L29 [Planctomycetota bacterium]
MKIAELRNQEEKELQAMLTERRKELFEMRFHSAAEQMESPSKIKSMRREIAQILTILRERELGIQEQTQG